MAIHWGNSTCPACFVDTKVLFHGVPLALSYQKTLDLQALQNCAYLIFGTNLEAPAECCLRQILLGPRRVKATALGLFVQNFKI